MARLLIIDESLSDSIVTPLKKRGRRAESHRNLGLTGRLDPDVLRIVARTITEPYVLVVGDDKMPGEHRELVAKFGTTIATVDGRWESFCERHDLDYGTQDQFQQDSIHRWSHIIDSQVDGEVRRYNPLRHALWTARKKYSD